MPTLILDFDDTLFDTTALKTTTFKAVKPFLIKKTWAFWQSRVARSKQGFYLYKRHIKQAVRSGQYQPAVQAYEQVVRASGKFIYPDTKLFLNQQYKNFDLIMLSYGQYSFQINKINQCKLNQYFKKIIITGQAKFTEFKKIKQQFSAPYYFMDNDSKELTLMKRNYSEVVCLRMRRSNDTSGKTGRGKFDGQITNLKINLQNYGRSH